jgi:transcriptional regulator GlxA family with amidase domain
MLTLGFFVFPSFSILDLSGPLATFDVPRREMRPSPYRIVVCSKEGGAIESSCGLSVNTVPVGASRFDTFVIVGGRGAIEASQDRATTQLVRRAAKHARRVASVCTGAFLLAATGMLDGRRATTHWEDAPGLKQAFPRVLVESDQIYLRDGQVWTSGGETSGIDLALAMIEEDLGLKMAQRVAQVLVVYHRRLGGQSQFSAMLKMEPATDRLRRALSFMREHLDEPLPVERIADLVHVGVRQLTRLFLKETGETPAKAVERMRAELAHAQLTGTSASIEVIARRVGFASAERMRRAFMRLYGNSPQAVRRSAIPKAKHREHERGTEDTEIVDVIS